MIHIKLGERRNVTWKDPMHRNWVGYDQTVPVEELPPVTVVGLKLNALTVTETLEEPPLKAVKMLPFQFDFAYVIAVDALV